MHNQADANTSDLDLSNSQVPTAQEARKQRNFARNLLWYSFGIWSLCVLSAILGTIVSEPGRFGNLTGIVVVALIGGPLMAAITGAVYAGWLKWRAWPHPEDARVSAAISLVAGLISIPLWLAAIGITLATFGFLGEYANWLCFAAIVAMTIAVSELALHSSQLWQRYNLKERV